MPDHKDRPPTTLAHGPAQSGDIERVRENVDSAKVRVADAAQASATRERRRRTRKTESKPPTK
jgi:hypothetical protein